MQMVWMERIPLSAQQCCRWMASLSCNSFVWHLFEFQLWHSLAGWLTEWLWVFESARVVHQRCPSNTNKFHWNGVTVLVFSECPLGLDTTFHCEHGDNLCANIATIAGSQQITSFLCLVSSPVPMTSLRNARVDWWTSTMAMGWTRFHLVVLHGQWWQMSDSLVAVSMECARCCLGLDDHRFAHRHRASHFENIFAPAPARQHTTKPPLNPTHNFRSFVRTFVLDLVLVHFLCVVFVGCPWWWWWWRRRRRPWELFWFYYFFARCKSWCSLFLVESVMVCSAGNVSQPHRWWLCWTLIWCCSRWSLKRQRPLQCQWCTIGQWMAIDEVDSSNSFVVVAAAAVSVWPLPMVSGVCPGWLCVCVYTMACCCWWWWWTTFFCLAIFAGHQSSWLFVLPLHWLCHIRFAWHNNVQAARELIRLRGQLISEHRQWACHLHVGHDSIKPSFGRRVDLFPFAFSL